MSQVLEGEILPPVVAWQVGDVVKLTNFWTAFACIAVYVGGDKWAVTGQEALVNTDEIVFDGPTYLGHVEEVE